MAMTNEEIKKVNDLYTQLDIITSKYHKALEDIHKLTTKITDYADALAIKSEKCCNSKKTTTRKTK